VSGATHVLFVGGNYAVLWGIDALPDAYAALTAPPGEGQPE
jgi:hypothetical protein